MYPTLRRLLSLGLLSILLTASQCFSDDDDDDATDDDDVAIDDDDAADDDDIDPPGPFVVSGQVIALDRDTGVVLNAQEYDERAGGLIVYALPDADDLSIIYGKDTLVRPGEYEITLDVLGPFDLVVVADEDKNLFIDSDDTARQYAFNPLAGADEDIEEVNLYIDLAVAEVDGDDDDGSPDDDDTSTDDDDDGCSTTLAGDVNIIGLPENDVAVTSNTSDLSVGPLRWIFREGSGPFGLDLGCHGERALLGYLDGDANGFFEPSDPLGAATGNPYVLGIGDVAGIQIDIPSLVPIEAPAPPAYVPLTGTVTYGSFTTGDIIVKAAHVTVDGYVFSSATLAAPGAFSLIAPADTENVLVWAVLDSDGDGTYDISIDPFASEGPMNTGLGASGILLDLGDAEGGSFTGTVFWDGAVGGGDVLHIAVIDTPVYDPADGLPVDFVVVPNPTFPNDFEFLDITPGTYWIGSYLDLGGDDPSGAGPEDPTANVGPFLLSPGGSVDDVVVQLSL